jgi:predicted TIM-barrel fold metal-dependent hydrolase
VTWQDDDPGLPIKLGPCSNGEFDPPPLSPFLREVIRRARHACDDEARRLGWSRRRFLLSLCGAATTLAVLDACSKDRAREEGRRPGGSYVVPPDARNDPDAARAGVGGEEFVFDVQGHLLEYDLARRDQTGADFWVDFPQGACGEADGRVCFDMAHFLELMFVKSDTNMVVISTLPLVPEGSPLSPPLLDETRRVAEALCHDQRVLLHAQALPNFGTANAFQEAMEAASTRPAVKAWKVYTHFRPPGAAPDRAWRLDDADPNLLRVGRSFLDTARVLGIRIVAVHKGFSGGDPAASPADVGPAARAHPDLKFVVYHSGYERGTPEGPYTPATADQGVNRLIKSLEQAGVGPGGNVYAELGSTWRAVMGDPDQAAHLIGKLLKHVGEDNVVWGTDSIFYGSPQDQIQAFRALQISEELQERHGYPALTPERKAKVLGRNGARLYGVDPVTVPCPFTRQDLEKVRAELPGRHQTYGPRTAAEVQAFADLHQGWP